ncbi:MAG: protoporphyrinogen oxidase [Ignavibacteria bacterium]|jgi:oxygen-dependent protoporphyrinogen oxidase|nr:protoporphyrinogen oxidase [Ignavibacteria bacterium]MCU7503698.1 protoporphyrinogen oxidase [Ignavibacteria bacterium]MCU7517655.1 protoporphyrinogen oxidase [Ignavibacteria bacterium]
MNKKAVILGAGISGLATAYWLKKDGCEVTVIEKSSQAGGAMVSAWENEFLVDYGPNSGLETTPLIRQLAEETGIADEMIYASSEGNKRYILRDGRLCALPTGAGAFLTTKLFSPKAKLRLLKEPFVGKSNDGYYQSIAEFVRRRLGQEFLDYAINPFVAGVYAGNPDDLSVKSAFPKLYRLEEVYGGLIKGMFKGAKERKQSAETSKQSARMFSFKNGMQTFPNAIAAKLEENLILGAEVKNIERDGGAYTVKYKKNGVMESVQADVVISTIPAHAACYLFQEMDTVLFSHLKSIYYPPVMVLYLGYKEESIRQPLDGFGYLIPQKENKSYLGAIWSSVIFPNRAPEGYASFTIFIGGARSPQLFDDMNKEDLIRQVLVEFQDVMKITGMPQFRVDKMWPRAIPQYNIGYIEHENYFEEFEKFHRGILLSGNYRGGISVGDCIKSSETVYKKALDLLQQV